MSNPYPTLVIHASLNIIAYVIKEMKTAATTFHVDEYDKKATCRFESLLRWKYDEATLKALLDEYIVEYEMALQRVTVASTCAVDT
jgi:hypothetical protein